MSGMIEVLPVIQSIWALQRNTGLCDEAGCGEHLCCFVFMPSDLLSRDVAFCSTANTCGTSIVMTSKNNFKTIE